MKLFSPWLLVAGSLGVLGVACGGGSNTANGGGDVNGGGSSGGSSGGGEPSSPHGNRCEKGGAAGEGQESLQVNGEERSFYSYVPEAALEKSVALVVALHGSGGKGEPLHKSLKLFEQSGDEAIIVYPDAKGGSFDLDTQDGNPDVAFYDELVALYQSSYCISKVFVTGFSRGGYFTNHLACYRGESIAAVASHGSGGPYAAPYNEQGQLVCPSAPTASLVVHGLADGSVAPSEGEKSIKQWRRTLECSESTTPSSPAPCVAYEGCDKPFEVCMIPELGHRVWDQGIAKTWSFFRAQL